MLENHRTNGLHPYGLYTAVAYHTSGRIRQTSFKMARDVINNKKGFFNYISSKRKARDNVELLLNEAGVLVTEDAEKAEVLNAAFASVFSAKAGPQESQAPEAKKEAYREEDFRLLEEDCVRDH